MDTSRKSKRSERRSGGSVVLVALVTLGTWGAIGCASPRAPATPVPLVTDVTLSDPPREPDGVVVEPPPALPEVDERAHASGVVALRPPLATEAVTTIVHRLFRAFAREDIEALQSTLTDDATVIAAPHATAPERRPLLEQWRARLKNLDYTRLAGTEQVQEAKIERFTFEDLGLPGGPERPAEMKRGELLVRFPVPAPRVGSEQLFGEEMTLVLRRDGHGYKIAAFGEDDAP